MSELRIEHLRRAFGSLVVTNDVSITVGHGERHAIIGPNGAGKTSLINQIGGQLRPNSGRIMLDGVDLTGRSAAAISRLGVARTFQRNNMFPGLSVLENVRLAVEVRHGNPLNGFFAVDRRPAQQQRARVVLQMVRLEHNADRDVAHLSYGEQRQLEVAIALAGDPKVLLLDEPTSGMSPAETHAMIDLVAALPTALSIVMIEHDMNVVFTLAHRITVLSYGEVLATDVPAAIRGNPRVRESYLGALPA